MTLRPDRNRVLMTLIVTVVTDSVIFQVSDRRISWQYPDRSTRVRDDTTNKAVLYENRFTFAAAGLAELEGTRADLWIARRLASRPTLAEGIDTLRLELTQLFRRQRYRGQFLSVMVAGWKYEEHGIVGCTGLVTNHFLRGRWLRTPFEEFDWFWEAAPPNSLGLFCVPGWLYPGEVSRLRRQLLRAKARGVNVVNPVRLVANAIREVNKEGNRSEVGKDLMVTILPKSASLPRDELMTVYGIVGPEVPAFYYLASDDSRTIYGPTFVAHGAVLSDFHGIGGRGVGMGVWVGPT
jgi:hypothetical protein